MNDKFKIAVIGSGTMGNGIAHVSAQSGFKTLLIDIDENQLKKALESINVNLDRQIKKKNIYQFLKGGPPCFSGKNAKSQIRDPLFVFFLKI